MARTTDMTEPEFTDDQIQRIDNLQAAAIDFFNVLMEADDYGFCWKMFGISFMPVPTCSSNADIEFGFLLR